MSTGTNNGVGPGGRLGPDGYWEQTLLQAEDFFNESLDGVNARGHLGVVKGESGERHVFATLEFSEPPFGPGGRSEPVYVGLSRWGWIRKVDVLRAATQCLSELEW